MTDFEKVSDDLRNLPSQGGANRAKNPVFEALIEGQTVFVPLDGVPYAKMQSRIRTGMVNRGYRITTRVHSKDGTVGLVIWAEKKVPA